MTRKSGVVYLALSSRLQALGRIIILFRIQLHASGFLLHTSSAAFFYFIPKKNPSSPLLLSPKLHHQTTEYSPIKHSTLYSYPVYSPHLHTNLSNQHIQALQHVHSHLPCPNSTQSSNKISKLISNISNVSNIFSIFIYTNSRTNKTSEHHQQRQHSICWFFCNTTIIM